ALLLSISLSHVFTQLQRICVCGPQRQPCPCPEDYQNKLEELKNRVIRVYAAPSSPVSQPVQNPYINLLRNLQPPSYAQNSIIEQPIGYVLTTSTAEAFYIDTATGQLLPTSRPTPRPVQTLLINQPPPPMFSTGARQTFLVNGGAPVESRSLRVARRPFIPFYGNPTPHMPSLHFPTPSISLPVSSPFISHQPSQPIQQPTRHLVQSHQPISGGGEPNYVSVSQLTRVVNQRTTKRKFTLEKPRPGDVEDLTFVDGGFGEDDIGKKNKAFKAGFPPSAVIGEVSPVVKTRPRSLLETLPPGLIAKVATKIAVKLPPPKFSFSITPSKSAPSF
ncbi:hypothetical protein PFISCL1PPCAC_2190, partial [Pristionchus fissidentatus]